MDEVVTRWRVHGTQKGDFLGVPATNKEIEITGLTLSVIKDDKIKESWLEWDSLSMMQQLGAIPTLR
ncbi:MAG: ester cyclase [Chloroflexi bacterium]|nr:ester cyclase [Chloroflexota bacterium]